MAKIIVENEETMVHPEVHAKLIKNGYKISSSDTHRDYGTTMGSITYKHPDGHSVHFSQGIPSDLKKATHIKGTPSDFKVTHVNGITKKVARFDDNDGIEFHLDKVHGGK